ncbi:hypothetical protein [Sphingobium bisphenolivorans]|uniref:hypothetical protein n=1 Tax=Sphingobium bisphenolivorans TaxID=1335760 RepID=UPI0009DBEABC|nr:hypothetical protein [Sphingobium bisphenolivorans]
MDENHSAATDDRRGFLKTCGKFAATVPPAMTILLSTSLTSPAIAQSASGGGGGSIGGGSSGGGGRPPSGERGKSGYEPVPRPHPERKTP